MNTYYDFSYFLPPDAAEAEEALEKIKNEIKNREGVIIEESVPSKKQLSYEIRKNKDGIFGTIKFLLNPENINLLTLKLEKDKNILRFVVRKIQKKDDARSYKKRTKMFVKKTVPQKKQDEKQIAEIDKKIDELLGSTELN